jgi:hypothetical protein
MRLFAHVRADGEIQGLIATLNEKRNIMLQAPPGVQVCEIAEHGLKGKAVDLDALSKLLQTHTVEVSPARGKLVRDRK